MGYTLVDVKKAFFDTLTAGYPTFKVQDPDNPASFRTVRPGFTFTTPDAFITLGKYPGVSINCPYGAIERPYLREDTEEPYSYDEVTGKGTKKASLDNIDYRIQVTHYSMFREHDDIWTEFMLKKFRRVNGLTVPYKSGNIALSDSCWLILETNENNDDITGGKIFRKDYIFLLHLSLDWNAARVYEPGELVTKELEISLAYI